MAWLMWMASVLPLFWWCCCQNFCDGACRRFGGFTYMTAGVPTVTITISGVGDGTCTDCAAIINGTWVVSRGGNCNWNDITGANPGIFACGTFNFYVDVRKVASDSVVYFRVGTATVPAYGSPQGIAIRTKTMGTAPQRCHEFGVVSVDEFVSDQGPQCDWSAIVVTVEF